MKDLKFNVNDLSELSDSLDLAKIVFQPTPEEIAKYHQLHDWEQIVKNGGLLITAHKDDILAGFAICDLREKDALHIWNAGIHPEYQGRGIWRGIFGEVEKFAHGKDYLRITLNTHRIKFPVMYNFAKKHGFIEYKTETHEGLEKSFFNKDI